jgi:type IX secretion system PorP/SprF family membrane protein
MRNFIFTFLFSIILAPILVFGQQDPQFSQYIFNQQFYNPSVVSNESLPKVQLLHRSQYLGYASNFDKGGTLNTQLLSIQLPLAKANAGIGLIIINDQAGLEKNQQLRFSFAKNLKIASGALSVGISAGFYNKSFDNSFRPREGNDPIIPSNSFSQIKPDFGIGLKYDSRYIFSGISVMHLNNPKFDFGATNGNTIINRTITGLLGIKIPINNKIELRPNLLVRSNLQVITLEGGLLADIGNKYWIGTNYRNKDAAVILLGTNLLNNSLKLGAAYDFVTNLPKVKSNASFEIMASYLIGAKNTKTKKPVVKSPIIRTPRYRH